MFRFVYSLVSLKICFLWFLLKFQKVKKVLKFGFEELYFGINAFIWSNICRIWMKSRWWETLNSEVFDVFCGVFVGCFAACKWHKRTVNKVWWDPLEVPRGRDSSGQFRSSHAKVIIDCLRLTQYDLLKRQSFMLWSTVHSSQSLFVWNTDISNDSVMKDLRLFKNVGFL